MTNQINVDPQILGGTPVFNGTRVPIAALFDYLRGQHSLDDFLLDFPSVSRAQAVCLLIQAQEAVLTTQKDEAVA